jgi:hypothetical protein
MSRRSRRFNVKAHMMFKEQLNAAIECAARWRDSISIGIDACQILSCHCGA